MSIRLRVLPLIVVALLPGAVARTASVPPRPAAVALADTGLFAPVARQHRERLERLASTAPLPADERALLLLATGQSGAALALMAAQGDRTTADRVAHGRALLARLEFEPLAPLVATFAPGESGSVGVRALRYADLAARDDAPALDALTSPAVAGHDDARAVPELLAAGRLAFDRLDYARAESCWTRALAVLPGPPTAAAYTPHDTPRRAAAFTGLALVQQKRRDWDGSLATLREALETNASPAVLIVLTETLIRLGRTDEAISAAEWG